MCSERSIFNARVIKGFLADTFPLFSQRQTPGDLNNFLNMARRASQEARDMQLPAVTSYKDLHIRVAKLCQQRPLILQVP